jgi:curved DNA-binding protein CbpA
MTLLRAELAELVRKGEKAALHELIGVSEDASVEAVRAAFFQLARKWHPDRLPAFLADMRADATRVFAKINEAHRILSNEEQRREYYQSRSQPTIKSGEHQQVQMVLNAATEFQKAEILAKKHDLAGAEELAERAYKTDPEQAEYGALYAWIVAHNPAQKQKNYAALLEILDKAVKSEPENVRVHYYRATVLKRAGKQEEAIKEFRFILSREPNNLEAGRELRLHKMRSPEKEPTTGGVFGKLFKR